MFTEKFIKAPSLHREEGGAFLKETVYGPDDMASD